MKKEKIFLLGWLVMAVALVLVMLFASPARAEIDLEKLERLLLLTADKGKVDLGVPCVYLEKIEKVGDAERRLFFVVHLAITPLGVISIIGFSYGEELEEKKIIGNESVVLVTQKMGMNGNVSDGFLLTNEEGRIISHDTHAVADLAAAEKWLDGFLAEMIEFSKTLPERPPATETPPEEPAPSPTKVVPKWNDIVI